jgi:hypothetical protein
MNDFEVSYERLYEELRDVRWVTEGVDIPDRLFIDPEDPVLAYDKNFYSASLLAVRCLRILKVMVNNDDQIPTKFDHRAAEAFDFACEIEKYLAGNLMSALLSKQELEQMTQAEHA